jgi:hypothetical protein
MRFSSVGIVSFLGFVFISRSTPSRSARSLTIRPRAASSRRDASVAMAFGLLPLKPQASPSSVLANYSPYITGQGPQNRRRRSCPHQGRPAEPRHLDRHTARGRTILPVVGAYISAPSTIFDARIRSMSSMVCKGRVTALRVSVPQASASASDVTALAR